MSTAVIVYSNGAVKAEKRKGKAQRIRVDGPALRLEVNSYHRFSPEDGRTFENMDEYLRKYHGFKHFAMTSIDRDGGEIVVDIRHFGLRERFLAWLKGL